MLHLINFKKCALVNSQDEREFRKFDNLREDVLGLLNEEINSHSTQILA